MVSSGSRAGTSADRDRGCHVVDGCGDSLVLWAMGMGTSYTAGGLVHLLLVIAAVVVVFQFLGAAGPSAGPTMTCAVDRSTKT